MNSRLGLLCGRQDWKCFYCKRQMTKARHHTQGSTTAATIDEVYPRSKGGLRVLSNQVAACKMCNSIKGDKTLEEFRLFMEHPEFLSKISSTSSERRRARKERKIRRRQLAATTSKGKTWNNNRLPKAKADLSAVFKTSLASLFPEGMSYERA